MKTPQLEGKRTHSRYEISLSKGQEPGAFRRSPKIRPPSLVGRRPGLQRQAAGFPSSRASRGHLPARAQRRAAGAGCLRPPPRSSCIPGRAGRGRTLTALARDPGCVLPGGRGGRAGQGRTRGAEGGWGGQGGRSRGWTATRRAGLILDPGAVTPEGHSGASPGAGSSEAAAGVEPGRRERHAAPRAGEGRAELGFLEERRKLCPFLEGAEVAPREAGGRGCRALVPS